MEISTDTTRNRPHLRPHRKMTARIYPPPTAPSPSSRNKTRVMIYHRVCPSERLDYPSPSLAASLMIIRRDLRILPDIEAFQMHDSGPRCISGFYACWSSHSRGEREPSGEPHIYHDYVDLSIAVVRPKGLTMLAPGMRKLFDWETRLTHEAMQVTLAFFCFLPKYVWGAANRICDISNGGVVVVQRIDHQEAVLGIHTVKVG